MCLILLNYSFIPTVYTCSSSTWSKFFLQKFSRYSTVYKYRTYFLALAKGYNFCQSYFCWKVVLFSNKSPILKNVKRGLNRCLDETSKFTTSTVTFWPNQNVHCNILSLWQCEPCIFSLDLCWTFCPSPMPTFIDKMLHCDIWPVLI